jgi:hypothetical protein
MKERIGKGRKGKGVKQARKKDCKNGLNYKSFLGCGQVV